MEEEDDRLAAGLKVRPSDTAPRSALYSDEVASIITVTQQRDRVVRGRWSRLAVGPALALIALALSPSCRASETVSRLDQIGPALAACWKPPAGSEGLELTVSFSLKRSGELRGHPQFTYQRLGSDAALNQAFTASVVRSLAQCTPLPLTDSLGAAVAGRIFKVRFRLGGTPI